MTRVLPAQHFEGTMLEPTFGISPIWWLVLYASLLLMLSPLVLLLIIFLPNLPILLLRRMCYIPIESIWPVGPRRTRRAIDVVASSEVEINKSNNSTVNLSSVFWWEQMRQKSDKIVRALLRSEDIVIPSDWLNLSGKNWIIFEAPKESFFC